MPEKRPIGRGLVPASGLIAAAALAVYFFRGHPPRPAFGDPVPGGGFFPAADHGVSILGALIFGALLVAAGAGLRKILRTGGGPPPFALGAAYASLLSLLLLAAGAFRPALFVPLLLVPALFAARSFRPSLPSRPATDPWTSAALLLLALAGIDLLIRTLAPLTANDAVVYHMTLARGYAESGGFGGAPDLVYGKMPHGGDLLYAGAYLLGGEGAARVFHLLLAAACARLAASIARLLRPGASGLPAAVLFLTLPLVLDPRTVGNVDLAAALFFGASLLLLLRPKRSGPETAAAALLAGSMLTVKYSVLPAYAVLAGVLLFPPLGGRRGRWKELLLFTALSVLPFLPWAVKAWAQTGNPLFPLLPGFLGGEGWDPVLGERLVAWQRSIGGGRGLVDWILLPWNVVFHGQPRYDGFDGVLSPVLFVWSLWAAVRGGRTARRALLLVLAGLLLWGLGSRQLRFFLPCLLLASAVAGAWWRTERGRAGALQGALFLAIPLLLLAPTLRETARDALPVVLGKEREEAYLTRKVQSFEAFGRMERVVPEGEKVALLWENRVYYLKRPYIADSFFEASRMARRAERAGSPGRFLDMLREEGASWILVNRPLGGVFSRFSPPRSVAVMEEALRRSTPAGAWRGLELFRIPEASESRGGGRLSGGPLRP